MIKPCPGHEHPGNRQCSLPYGHDGKCDIEPVSLLGSGPRPILERRIEATSVEKVTVTADWVLTYIAGQMSRKTVAYLQEHHHPLVTVALTKDEGWWPWPVWQATISYPAHDTEAWLRTSFTFRTWGSRDRVTRKAERIARAWITERK